MQNQNLQIPPKRSNELLQNGQSMAERMRQSLKIVGDRMLLANEKERNGAYRCALQIGIKVVTRKLTETEIYAYRIK